MENHHIALFLAIRVVVTLLDDRHRPPSIHPSNTGVGWRMDKCPFMSQNSSEISILMFDGPILFTVYTHSTDRVATPPSTSYLISSPQWVGGWLVRWPPGEKAREGSARRFIDVCTKHTSYTPFNVNFHFNGKLYNIEMARNGLDQDLYHCSSLPPCMPH